MASSSSSWSLQLLLCCVVLMASGQAMGAALRRPIAVPFGRNYVPTWAFDHIKYYNGGSDIQLSLDKYTGTGFQSKGSYLFGHFSMDIKLPPGDSAGVVTAFYLSSQNSEHDEIDFEFLGNRSGQPITLQTNVFTGGQGNREQRINLWFDPSKTYHSYSVLWNMYIIVFFVDNIPIRVFKNSKELGVRFPFNQPMKLYSSLWNADDWATRGGLEKTDWSKAPFVHYKKLHVFTQLKQFGLCVQTHMLSDYRPNITVFILEVVNGVDTPYEKIGVYYFADRKKCMHRVCRYEVHSANLVCNESEWTVRLHTSL